jgi:hypothetical protein
MEKILYSVIFLLLFTTVKSQEIVRNEIDEFEKVRIIETNWMPIYKGFMPGKTYLFRFSSIDSNIFLDLKISTTNNKIFSVSEGENKFLLKCNDSIVLRFSNSHYEITESGGGSEGMWGGTTYGLWLRLNINNLEEFLMIKQIEKFRIYTNEGYIDEEISAEKSKQILELVQLFSNTFKKYQK